MEYLKKGQPQEEGATRQIRDAVSEILSAVEKEGIAAVRRYSEKFDGWNPQSFVVSEEEIRRAEESVEDELKEHIEFAKEQVQNFARLQRETLTDFEKQTLPGVVLGQKQIPVNAVGSYTPSGQYPMFASSIMTVAVAKVAGVKRVVAIAAPHRGEDGKPYGIYEPMLYTMASCGADQILCLGGVQALAAVAFGMEEVEPVDMIVGAGNAYVAEAKRQLFGEVGIDLLAGPTEIAIIADETAEPHLLAADLLGQAEHGPTSPAVLITTSREVGEETIREVDRWLEGDWPTKRMAGEAWRNHGEVILCESDEEMVKVSDEIAPEHLEVQTRDPEWFLERLTNYGSLFLGEHSTVAYSDKAIGTNHVLPTNRAARYTGGLWVGKFTKTVTYQKVSEEGTRQVAPAAAAISDGELMYGHALTCRIRQERAKQSPKPPL
ncbi:histidinol dehydrogenase [Rubrobacter taiwanensis]|jgi:sulfopropanediol 3-dehydrogenase|uniref:Histidinol dehydrogenase n=1 Tax=Rubrobacter taiwanensis TaxID=185139 RepID=A0A4R1BGY5_9ACTN|nr:histidinol dehydrogenase [Rubrobacter taiwanensis]TCJ16480.1 histidinol dehydrogenase [Rubrobacter taiwanensis]